MQTGLRKCPCLARVLGSHRQRSHRGRAGGSAGVGKGKCLAQLLSGPICANECRWRPLGILYGHGDTERASFRRRRAGYALQQQRGGQRSFERDRSGGKHQRNLHSEHVYSSDINFRDDLGVL